MSEITGITPLQKLSVAIDHSIRYQPYTWKNWLSRKTSDYLFGQEFPFVPEGIKKAVKVLGVNDQERRYLEGYATLNIMDSKTRDELFPAFLRSVSKFRKQLNPANPTSPEVSDRMNGMLLAMTRTTRLVGDQILSKQPNFDQALTETGRGLVTKESEFIRDFRQRASLTGKFRELNEATEVSTKPAIDQALGVLNITKSENDFLRSYDAFKNADDSNRDSAQTTLLNSETAFREELNRDNQFAPEVDNRLDALIMAYKRIINLIGNQEFRRLPNFNNALQFAGNDLVDKESKYFKDFRAKAVGNSPQI